MYLHYTVTFLFVCVELAEIVRAGHHSRVFDHFGKFSVLHNTVTEEWLRVNSVTFNPNPMNS